MKKTLYIFLLISQVFWAQNAFEKGNQYYQKENYQEAITSYESVLASGKQSAEVYFNLGNSYYKLHKIAPAVYNYEKALQLDPNDNEIQTNLDFARKMAIDDIKVIPKVGFKKIIADFTSRYHYDTWAWATVVFAFVFFLFFVGYYYSGTAFKKRIFFAGMFLILVGIAMTVFAAIFEKNRLMNEKPAIVFADTVSVKSEPKVASPETFLLHEGTKVYVLESIANWKKIQLTDETTGWIDSESIKELN
ncbi:MAG: tetratricopeptide repeat protein [Bacteroidota bacterium]